MPITYAGKHVRVVTNLNEIIYQMKQLQRISEFRAGVAADENKNYRVTTIVPYAPAVEYGLSRQQPSAMIRNSIPSIKEFGKRQFANLPKDFLFKQGFKAFDNIMHEIMSFAYAQIISRTPVDTGLLIRSWTLVEPR